MYKHFSGLTTGIVSAPDSRSTVLRQLAWFRSVLLVDVEFFVARGPR
jgi:hypothetical protein